MNAKLVVILACSLLLSVCNTQAQQKVRYSVDMGLTVSCFNLKTPPYPDPVTVAGFSRTNRTSFELGLNADYPVSPTVSMSTGLRYSGRGGAYKTKDPNFFYIEYMSGDKPEDDYNYLRYRLTYLEAPLVAKINIYELLGEKAVDSDLKVYGGISGMFNTNSELRYNVFNSEGKESWKKMEMNGAEPIVLCGVAGVEWREGPILIYARYSRTLGNVYDTSKAGYENFDLQMTTISLGLGLVMRQKNLEAQEW